MFSVGFTAKAIALCAAGFGAALSPALSPYAIPVRAGAAIVRQPDSAADAQAITKLWHALAIGGSFPTCMGGRIETRTSKSMNGYVLQVHTPGSAVSRYTVNTPAQTVTPR